MGSIWFSSDFHYGHQNIVRGVSDWEDKTPCRDYDTMEGHNETLIKNINKAVQWDDILYFVGDWAMGGRDNIWKFRNRLYVRNIHFIGGNHDHHVRNNAILKADDRFINAQSLFSSYHEILEKKINGQSIVLCHYPMRAWPNAKKGYWMLWGHEHGDLVDPAFDKYKTMDVGIDTHPEFRPYHFDEIKQIMDKRITLGHHETINQP